MIDGQRAEFSVYWMNFGDAFDFFLFWLWCDKMGIRKFEKKITHDIPGGSELAKKRKPRYGKAVEYCMAEKNCSVDEDDNVF